MSLSALLSRLDSSQSAFVDLLVNGKGDVQVRAGAGSGKTTSTVAGVGALLASGVPASEVVVTTFTSKAGKELVDRLSKILDPSDLAQLRVGTFHGLGLRSSKNAGRGFNMSLCLDTDTRKDGIPSSRQLWAKALGWDTVPGLREKGLDLDLEKIGKTAGDYQMAVDVLRSLGVEMYSSGVQQLVRAAEEEKHLPALYDAWWLVEEAKASLGAWDFADVLSGWHRALSSGRCKDSASVVIVDEAQDNSWIQLEIAKLLVKNGKGRLVLVGDSRQAIYSWRGAVPEIFSFFSAEGGATPCDLPSNYRSGSAIVEIGNAVADGKPWAVGVASEAKRPLEGVVKVLPGAATPIEEAAEVAQRIAADVSEGADPSAYAVLVRTNAMSGPFEAELVRARVPVVVVGGIPFFKRADVQDVMAYATLIQGDSLDSVERICNKPKRFLGKAFVDSLKAAYQGGDIVTAIRKLAPSLRGGSAQGALSLAADIEAIRKAAWRAEDGTSGLDLIPGILRPKAANGDGSDSDEDAKGILASAAGIAKTFGSAEELVSFAALCSGVKAAAEGDKDALKGRVTVSTIHRAKGLEWDRVFVSASQGVFPHTRSLPDEERMEEEERLFYVAVTRARDALSFSWSEENLYGKEAGKSQFLSYVKGGGDDGDDGVEEEKVEEEKAPEITTVVVQFTGEVPRKDWETAHSVAVLRTAQEPKASSEGGEGARYVEVRAESFPELLSPLGFSEAGAQKGQRVWNAFSSSLPGVILKVYSTVPPGGEEAREVGEDSIRVAATFKGKPVLPKEAWVCRTRGWRGALLRRLEGMELALSQLPVCSCGSPMRERVGQGGRFLGCISYPECRETRRIS